MMDKDIWIYLAYLIGLQIPIRILLSIFGGVTILFGIAYVCLVFYYFAIRNRLNQSSDKASTHLWAFLVLIGVIIWSFNLISKI